MPYGISVTLNIPYAQTLGRTRDALKAEGFGVITEIDVKKTMNEKSASSSAPT